MEKILLSCFFNFLLGPLIIKNGPKRSKKATKKTTSRFFSRFRRDDKSDSLIVVFSVALKDTKKATIGKNLLQSFL